jgi:hypothetical protein
MKKFLTFFVALCIAFPAFGFGGLGVSGGGRPTAGTVSQFTPKSLTRPDTMAACGTSRIISQFLDAPVNGIGRNLSNASWINWANAYLRQQNKELITLGNFAVSGSRTDQYNCAAALALNPAWLIVDGPINNFAAQLPSAGTTVAQALSDLKAIFKAANDQGTAVIYVWERGAENYNSTMIGNLNDFSRLFADYISYGDDYRGPPNVVVIDQTPSTVNTSSNGTIDLKNTQDGTHDNIPAGQLLGQAAATKLAPYLRERTLRRLASLNDSKAGFTGATRGIAQSAGLTGSVAVSGTGNSGTMATNMFTSNCTGGITAVYSTQATSADANGNTWGNELKVIFTAPAAGVCPFGFTLDKSNIAVGDFIRAGVEIDVSAATGLGSVAADIEWFPSTGGTVPAYDMIDSTLGTDAGGYTNLPLEPLPLPITTFTGQPFTNLRILVTFRAAGSMTLLVRKPWAYRATQ